MQIELQSNDYHVLLNTLGAELNSYSDPSGKEYIWNSDPTYWLRSSPLLFPVVGNVRNGETVIKDHIYQMPKHGFCKESEFEVTEQTENSATFLLKTNNETLKHYPYSFELYLTYTLNGSTLSMNYKIINNDSEFMYYHIGAHPGFMLPVSDGENIENCILRFEKEEEFTSYKYNLKNLEFDMNHKVSQKAVGNTLPLTISMFDQDAVFFECTNSHRVSFLNSSTGKGVSMYYPDFESLAIWTPIGGKAPFLCLEPWNGSAIFHQDDDILAHKHGILSLAPGKEKTYHLEISLIE